MYTINFNLTSHLILYRVLLFQKIQRKMHCVKSVNCPHIAGKKDTCVTVTKYSFTHLFIIFQRVSWKLLILHDTVNILINNNAALMNHLHMKLLFCSMTAFLD